MRLKMNTSVNPVNPMAISEFAKDAIESVEKALDVYNKVVDNLIPWDSYIETCKEIERFKSDYSNEAADLVGQAKTLLLDSQDAYFNSTQCIYKWCGITLNLVPIYIKNLDAGTNLDAQRAILKQVITIGIKNIEDSIKNLNKSSESFNQLTGKLTSLGVRLDSDFDTKSAYFNSRIDDLRKKAYGGAAAGAILGPFGLIISYSIASGVLEGKLIPELKKQLEGVKKFFEELNKKVENTKSNIGGAKETIKDEIQSISDLETTSRTIDSLVEFDTSLKDEMITLCNRLIDQCNAYQKRHGRK
jgi:hemolysin E